MPNRPSAEGGVDSRYDTAHRDHYGKRGRYPAGSVRESGGVQCRRLMHLLINIPPRDIDILILTPFSMNSDLQFFLEQYPKSIITSESTSVLFS